MTGTLFDSLLTTFSRKRKRAKGAKDGAFAYLKTQAGYIRYVDTGGIKPVLLTTPDAPCVIEHHEELTCKLSEYFRVICFEMPGCGFSFPSARYSFRVDETADLIIELMDGLAVERAALAFTCVNGLHAMNLAARFPDRVTHLALAQIPSVAAMRHWTGQNIPSPLRIPYIGQIAGKITAKTLTKKWFSMSLPRPSIHQTPFTHMALTNQSSGGCYCLSSIVQGAERTPDEAMLGASAPTIMIYGDTDYSHRHTDFNDLTHTVPQAAVLKYEGCGHFPHLECPDVFVADLRKFILTFTDTF